MNLITPNVKLIYGRKRGELLREVEASSSFYFHSLSSADSYKGVSLNETMSCSEVFLLRSFKRSRYQVLPNRNLIYFGVFIKVQEGSIIQKISDYESQLNFLDFFSNELKPGPIFLFTYASVDSTYERSNLSILLKWKPDLIK